jgi:hypothetical protein
MASKKSKFPSLLKRFKNLIGVGLHLLLLGLLLEALTIAIRRWISFPLSITVKMQVVLTVPCITLCLLGIIWFNSSLNLIKVNLLNGKDQLITHGPFN